MRYKTGVDMVGVKPEINAIDVVVNQAFEEHGQHCVCSEVMPTIQHMAKSRHNSGFAKDYTFKHIPKMVRAVVAGNIVSALKERLPHQYDVVGHASHVHVEFDPK